LPKLSRVGSQKAGRRHHGPGEDKRQKRVDTREPVNAQEGRKARREWGS